MMIRTAAKAVAIRIPAIANLVHQRDTLLQEIAELRVKSTSINSGPQLHQTSTIVSTPVGIPELSTRILDEELSTPLPDPELIFLVNGHRDPHVFGISRIATVKNIIDLLARASVDFRDFRSILDFGCGCGRVLAGWERVLPPGAKLFGCDVNRLLIEFCQKNIVFAETVVSSYYPPLPYSTAQFDFIYAASVYTHLTLPALLQWTGELARLSRPGGIVMVSYHGSYFGSLLAGASKQGTAQLAERGYYVHVHGNEAETWLGSNNYATFLSPEFVFNVFQGFELVKVYPGVSEGPNPFASYQDIVVFRRLSD
jgi:SAM-dependent methyltransferase